MPDERRSAMAQHALRHRPSPFASRIMSEEYLINFTPQETRVALMQQGVVQEVHVERTASRGIVGNI